MTCHIYELPAEDWEEFQAWCDAQRKFEEPTEHERCNNYVREAPREQ